MRISLLTLLCCTFLLFSFPTVSLARDANWEEPWDRVEARSTPIKTKRKVINHRIKSQFKGYSIPFKVMLPSDYDINTTRHYGVLILLCGKSGKDRGSGVYPPYFSIWCKWPALLDNLNSGKLSKKNLGWKVTDDELAVMNAKLQEDSFEEMIVIDLWHPCASRDTNYDQFVTKELLPFLDENYRTIPNRDYRAIDGACGGGAIALITTFRNPEYFANVGGMQTDLGTFPNVFKFLKENVDKIKEYPLKVNLNTNKNDVCNSYYFRNSKGTNGVMLKTARGALAKLEARLEEIGCTTEVNVFRYCKHGYSAYRYPNGHQTAYFWGKTFKDNRRRDGKFSEPLPVVDTKEVQLETPIKKKQK
jgi:hypothetical protein